MPTERVAFDEMTQDDFNELGWYEFPKPVDEERFRDIAAYLAQQIQAETQYIMEREERIGDICAAPADPIHREEYIQDIDATILLPRHAYAVNIGVSLDREFLGDTGPFTSMIFDLGETKPRTRQLEERVGAVQLIQEKLDEYFAYLETHEEYSGKAFLYLQEHGRA